LNLKIDGFVKILLNGLFGLPYEPATGLMYAVARDITELVKLERAKEND
jgi:hypothetical protein